MRARQPQPGTRQEKSADLRAASSGSGGNIDNATRQNVRRMLENGNNWTPDETELLNQVVRGTPTQNAPRLAGKLSPSGIGLMAALDVGATATNPLFAFPALGGIVAKSAADRMTQANAAKFMATILAGRRGSGTFSVVTFGY